MALAKDRGVAAGVNQGLPLVGGFERQIELQMQVDIDEARHILRPLNVTRHPVNGVGRPT